MRSLARRILTIIIITGHIVCLQAEYLRTVTREEFVMLGE